MIRVDPSLSPDSVARAAIFPSRHVLIRPYIPERIHTIPGCEHLPFEQRTIVMPQRDARHPVIWGWVLAAREDDLVIDPALEPGVMVVFKRFGNEPVGIDKPANPRWLGHTLPVDIVHIDSIECVFSPALVEQEAAA